MTRSSLLSLVIATSAFVLPLSASAHEQRTYTIGDKSYAFTVGSLNEPVRVDDKSGVEMMVSDISSIISGQGTGTPQTGLEQTLKVEVSAGDKKKVFDLRPVYGKAGSYSAVFYPTVQTTYTYRIYGTINATPVDLTFACKPAETETAPADATHVELSAGVTQTLKTGAFGCPTAREDVSFPDTVDSAAHMTERLNSVEGSHTNAAFGIIGMVFGIIGMSTGSRALRAVQKS